MPEGFQRLQIGDTITLGDEICLTTDFTSDNFDYLVSLATGGVSATSEDDGISLTATPEPTTGAVNMSPVFGGFSLYVDGYEVPAWISIFKNSEFNANILAINYSGGDSQSITLGNGNSDGDCLYNDYYEYNSLDCLGTQILDVALFADFDISWDYSITPYGEFIYMISGTSNEIQAFEEYLLPFLCIKHNS